MDPETAAGIAELPRIVGFRNLLIHGYANVDHRIVWGVVEGQLPKLTSTIAGLLTRA